MRFQFWASQAVAIVFQYETLKILSVNSLKVSLLCRFIQLVILGYIIGYVIIHKKGYQEFETGVYGIISKVKGVSYTDRNNTGIDHVWDVADYVIPPEEKDAIYVTTNAFVTRMQTQGQCPEDRDIPGSKCTLDKDCVPFDPIMEGDGIKTGLCNNITGTCDIYAWCPVENRKDETERSKRPLLKNIADFTILIKNTVQFVKFNVTRSNIPLDYDKVKLRNCRYDPVKDRHCPIFIIGTILNMSYTSYDDIASQGGIISFRITWDCDFDKNINACFPTYDFSRIDVSTSTISQGWNFRYANYYYINNTLYRDLIKSFGIRFMISLSSKAGRFHIIPLTQNIGAGLGLLVIATIICDFLVFNFLTKKSLYKEAKYQRVQGDDAYKVVNSLSASITSG